VNPLWLPAGPAVAFVVGLLVVGRDRRVIAAVAWLGALAALGTAVAIVADHPWTTPLVDDGREGPWAVMPFATLVDGLSITVVVLVCVVALLVQIFSVGYLREQPRYGTYAAFVSLFTAAMLVVVVAGDLLLLVVGWEVMGLCSYVLISQYWEREEARAAAVKSFLVTKAGDVGFILGVIVLGAGAGSFLISDVVAFGSGNDEKLTSLGTMLLLLGVLGKSAQFPLHAWLPDAMAGPSPVSALIHAATMVAAGVFVVLRLYPLFVESGPTMVVLPVIACITMLGAAVAALTQLDLKRVLAWSTVSQLALMLGAASVGSTTAATFSLVAHGFFKALLFLAAGAVIHAVGTTRLDELGGVRRTMPWTSAAMAVGLLALAGIPVLSGFFSKESVFVAAEQAARGETVAAAWVGWTVLGCALVTTALTAAYALRVWLLAFCGTEHGGAAAHEARVSMLVPLGVLVVPAVLFGFTGLRAEWFPTWSLPEATQIVEPVALRPQTTMTVVSLALVAVGALVVFVRWRRTGVDPVPQRSRWAVAARDGFGMDRVYDWLAVRPFAAVSRVVAVVDDRVVVGGIDGVGATAMAAGRTVSMSTPRGVQRGLSVAAAVLVVALVVVVVLVGGR
jgi:NADH-quinone oxidoreductase subunit L